MSDLTPTCSPSTDYVDLPGADDFVDAPKLKEAINDEICCCINAIITRLNMLTRGDNTLQDNLIRSRMVHPEFKDLVGGFGLFLNAKVVATSDLDLDGAETIDGVAVGDGDVVLATGQTLPAENGAYTVSAGGPWARVADLPAGWAPTSDDDAVYVWIEEGDTYQFSAWVWNPSQDSTDPTVGTTEQTWYIFHQTLIPTLDADTLAALAGTEGTPDAANLFVTDEDPRLDPFTDTQDGLVPQPGVTATCNRFLCEDGTWSIPAAAAATGDYMDTDVDNIMGASGEITFPGTVGIHGLIDPVDDDDASNKGYVDDLIGAINITLTDLTNWKSDLDALNGIIACDGAGSYSVYDISSLEALETALDAIDGFVVGDGAGGFAAAAMTEDGSGNVTINGTLFVDDPTSKGLRLGDDYSNWIDFNYSPLQFIIGVNNPDVTDLNTSSIQVAVFDDTVVEQVNGCIELNHNWCEGTDLKPHVHWMPTTAGAGDVVWAIEYEIVRDGTTAGGGTTLTSIDSADGTAWEQKRASFTDIDGSSLEIGDQIYFRFYRNATSGSDTYSADAAVGTLGFHVKVNSLGSDAVGSKS